MKKTTKIKQLNFKIGLKRKNLQKKTKKLQNKKLNQKEQQK